MTRLDSWYHEKESAWLYQKVAAAEPDPRKRNLFLQLAAAAEAQAAKWVAAETATPPNPAPAALNGRDALKGALRMVLIGTGAGVVSFIVGRALGVAIGGG
jgi:hypothetical protein